MPLEHVLYNKENSIARITLNRPQALNALNKKLWRELHETLDLAEKDQEIRAIILTGSGRAFSTGDDIKEVSSLKTAEDVRAFFLNFALPVVAKILTTPKPIVAAVNGLAYGGGCEIVMLCDLVVASNDAAFAIPEALIGAIPPLAAVIGARVVGRLSVSMMILTGEPISAEEAKTIGLVNIVVPPNELIIAAEKLARSTMRAAPSSVGVIKKLLNDQYQRKDLERAVEELINILQTEEGKEGHMAFIEKRLPKWVEQWQAT
jgi:enoyl-CoA hydratase/3-hydroxyacyl-CoA dehydrogenase